MASNRDESPRHPLSRRFGALTGIAAALGLATSAAAHQFTADIPYFSPGSPTPARCLLDLYTPNGGPAQNAATIIYLHGGGYISGDKTADPVFLGQIADRGFNIVSMNYTLASPGVPSFPQAVRDVKAVIRWVRTDGPAFGLSPTIIILGHSAGATIGQTAAFANGVEEFELLTPPPGGYRVDGAIGLFGRYDLVWDGYTHGSPLALRDYLGRTIFAPGGEDLYARAAAITYVGPCTPPSKLIHGGNDPIVPPQHSVRLAGAMDAASIFNLLNIVLGAGHGTGPVSNGPYLLDEICGAIPLLLANSSAACPPTTPPAPPANDRCEDAQPIAAGTALTGSTLGATGVAAAPCAGGTDTRDAWFTFTAPMTRRYTFDTSAPGAMLDTTLTIFPGCGQGAAMACDDGSGSPAVCARVSAALTAGQGVLVRVAALGGASGPFTLSVDAGPGLAEPPPNDDCAAGLPVLLGSTAATTLGATPDGLATCGTADTEDIWFGFTSPAAAVFRFDTFGSDISDTTLAVLDACGVAPRGCNDNAEPGPGPARLELALAAGQAVLLRVAGVGGAEGNVRLNITQLPPPEQGACCVGVDCEVRILADCAAGVWHSGQPCSAAMCPPPPLPGACCTGTACEMVADAAACTGSFRGTGVACGGPGNPTACCPANFNLDGGVTVQDIFDFLAAYFSGGTGADFNGAGGVTVQDIFDFLAAYFTGCP